VYSGTGFVQVYRCTDLVQVYTDKVIVQGYRGTVVIHEYSLYKSNGVVQEFYRVEGYRSTTEVQGDYSSTVV
jgi:hypothetical protein